MDPVFFFCGEISQPGDFIFQTGERSVLFWVSDRQF